MTVLLKINTLLVEDGLRLHIFILATPTVHFVLFLLVLKHSNGQILLEDGDLVKNLLLQLLVLSLDLLHGHLIFYAGLNFTHFRDL